MYQRVHPCEWGVVGADVVVLAQWFIDHQLADGGWNCEWVEGSIRSSFHSTLNVLRGLLDYEQATGGSDALRQARHTGEEYLLERRLMYRQSDSEVVGPWVTQFTLSFRWQYGVLPAVDYFRSASRHDGTAPDPRSRMRLRQFVPPDKQTEHGYSKRVNPAGSGSRRTSHPWSPRSGSPSMANAR